MNEVVDTVIRMGYSSTMETAITVLAYTLAAVAVILGIAGGTYLFAKKEQIDAQTEAVKEDTNFRRLPMQTEKGRP